MERMHLMMLQNAMSVAKICAIRSTLGSEKTSYTCYQVQQRLTSSYHIIPVSFFHVFSFSLGTETTNPRVQRAARNRQLPMTNWRMNLFLRTWRGQTTLANSYWSRCGSLWKLKSLVGSYVLTKVPYNWEKHWVKLHRLQLFPKRSTKVHESSQCITIVYISSCSLITIPMKNHIWGFP